MKFFAPCESCKRRRFFIRARKVNLPTGAIATSKKLLCDGCNNKLQQLLEPDYHPFG